MKYPEIFDLVIPWVSFGVLWHITWEFILDTDHFKKWIFVGSKQAGRMIWLCAFLVGGCISLLYMLSIQRSLHYLAESHANYLHRTAPPNLGPPHVSQQLPNEPSQPKSEQKPTIQNDTEKKAPVARPLPEQAGPPFGNLKERCVKLYEELLDLVQERYQFEPKPPYKSLIEGSEKYRVWSESTFGIFQSFYLDRTLKIQKELATHGLVDEDMDQVLADHERQDAKNSPRMQVNEIERVAKGLKKLADQIPN